MSQDIEWLLKEKYQGEKSDAFFTDVRRLALGEPLGYLIGHVPFLNTTIYLDSRPLVPRPETEYWTEKAILQMNNETTSVLDLCAGSGCVGVAVAKALPHIQVDFSEIDDKHIPTIRKNITENGIAAERTLVYQTSLFQGIKGRYDFILANPPYINADLNQVDASVVDFEPHLALFGGTGGLEIINQLIAAAPQHLTHNGQLWIEHDPEQSIAITEIAATQGFACSTQLDQYGVERYSVLMLQ